jgi:predicted lipoprotein with Yx(FWY)xxD motif
MTKHAYVLILIAGLMGLTACSGASSSSGSAAPCVGPKTAEGGRDTVSTWCSAYGGILVNGKGYTLYASTGGKGSKPACGSSCATIWPPLTVSGATKLAPGLKKSFLGDIIRSNGSHQLTYGGYALYTYRADTGPHMVNGQGLKGSGGTWYVISAKTGKLIMTKQSTKHNSGNGPGY